VRNYRAYCRFGATVERVQVLSSFREEREWQTITHLPVTRTEWLSSERRAFTGGCVEGSFERRSSGNLAAGPADRSGVIAPSLYRAVQIAVALAFALQLS
jgi:hypothetical protein